MITRKAPTIPTTMEQVGSSWALAEHLPHRFRVPIKTVHRGIQVGDSTRRSSWLLGTRPETCVFG
jgi:hypothetical protein